MWKCDKGLEVCGIYVWGITRGGRMYSEMGIKLTGEVGN